MSALPTDYSSLTRELTRRAAAIHQPVNGTFELTERCNLGCQMCYVRQPAGDRLARTEELSPSQWLTIARDAAANGMVFLLLTGGEIFVRPDFFEIYAPLTRLGLVLTLYSNGTLITDAVAKRLGDSPPNCMEITLYGATQRTYEAVTGVVGSHRRCLRGIEALMKYRIPLRLKSTITKNNVAELTAMRAMARDWGLPLVAGGLLTKRRDGKRSDVEDCRLSPREYVEFEVAGLPSADESPETSHDAARSQDDANFYCQAGLTAFVVGARGEMNVCLDLASPAARPLEIGFPRAWDEVQRFVDAVPPLSPACLACDVRSECPRCPAWSHLETGTLTEPVPYLCQLARERHKSHLAHG